MCSSDVIVTGGHHKHARLLLQLMALRLMLMSTGHKSNTAAANRTEMRHDVITDEAKTRKTKEAFHNTYSSRCKLKKVLVNLLKI